MPFHDKDWEDFQRDCDIFPAYSDYLYGPDERHVVTQEPGLHPQIYPAPPSAPTVYTNSMPSRSHTISGNHHVQRSSASRRQSLRRLTSGHETSSRENSGRNPPGLDARSDRESPTDAFRSSSRVQKTYKKEKKTSGLSSAPRKRGRPRLAASPSLSQSSVRPTRQQSQAKPAPTFAELSLLRTSSATDIDDSFPPASLPQSSAMGPASEATPQQGSLAQQLQQAASYPGAFTMPEPSYYPYHPQSALSSAEQPYYNTAYYPQQQMLLPPTTYQPYTPPQQSTSQFQMSPSQYQQPMYGTPMNSTYTPLLPRISPHLRQNINQHLAKVWKCLQIVQNPNTSADDVAAQTEKINANHWLMMFKGSLPPDGHDYMMHIVCRMIAEEKVGRRPQEFLQSLDMG